MRKAWLGGVVLLLLLSHVSRLFTLSSFEATPTQDGIRGVDFNQAYSALLFFYYRARGFIEVQEANN